MNQHEPPWITTDALQALWRHAKGAWWRSWSFRSPGLAVWGEKAPVVLFWDKLRYNFGTSLIPHFAHPVAGSWAFGPRSVDLLSLELFWSFLIPCTLPHATLMSPLSEQSLRNVEVPKLRSNFVLAKLRCGSHWDNWFRSFVFFPTSNCFLANQHPWVGVQFHFMLVNAFVGLEQGG